MKSNTKTARAEAKNLIVKYGYPCKNLYVTEVMNRTGISVTDMQNAFSFFQFSPSQESFRQKYFTK